MRGIKTRQKHLTYAIDAVDKALWWGEEALRCHYRRHKASQLFSRQCDKKQDWLYDEAHYCRQLRSVMEDRLSKAPRTVAQRYYVAWLEDQLRRLKEQYVALDSEQEQCSTRRPSNSMNCWKRTRRRRPSSTSSSRASWRITNWTRRSAGSVTQRCE